MKSNGLIDVIEELIEADMTKTDTIKNPQEEEVDEAKELKSQADSATDSATSKPTAKSGDNSSEVLGSETGAAMDAGGDKDVGQMDKGKLPSDATDNTDEVTGNGAGVLDAGGDKDVGTRKTHDQALPSDASGEIEADQGPHDQSMKEAKKMIDDDAFTYKIAQAAIDGEKEIEIDGETHPVDMDIDQAKKIVSEMEMDDEGDEEIEEGQDTTIQANANDAMLPDEDKDALSGQQTTSSEVEADKGDHDQASDAIETPTSANPEGPVSESSHSEAAMKAAEMYNADESCTYEMAAEKYGCSAEEVKACCSEMKAEEVDPDLDKDGDGDHDMDDHKAEEAEMDDHKAEEAEMDDDDELEESFKQKAAIVFETAVNEKANIIKEGLEEEYKVKLSEELEAVNVKISEYVDYAVQEWVKENQLEIKYSLRTEIAENFIKGLKGLFEESYIDIPEEEFSVVDELTEEVESVKEQLEETASSLAEAQAEILQIRRHEIVTSEAEGLTETQKIRLEKLSESVEADDIDEFRFKVEQLKESYFDPASENSLLGSLTEEVYDGVVMSDDDPSSVSQYAKFLSKTVQK